MKAEDAELYSQFYDRKASWSTMRKLLTPEKEPILYLPKKESGIKDENGSFLVASKFN